MKVTRKLKHALKATKDIKAYPYRMEQIAERLGLDHYGVEYVSVAGRELAYINTGDTYNETLCRESGHYWLGSWGDWLEAAEMEHCENEGVVRCGYCGLYTPLDESGEWRVTKCEHCSRNVAG